MVAACEFLPACSLWSGWVGEMFGGKALLSSSTRLLGHLRCGPHGDGPFRWEAAKWIWGLFPVVPSDRTRGSGHKLKQRKFQLNTRKNFFPLRVTEPWNRLPREVVESPSLEIFQTRLAAVLCSLLWVTLLWQGVGLGDPQRSLPTPNIL